MEIIFLFFLQKCFDYDYDIDVLWRLFCELNYHFSQVIYIP